MNLRLPEALILCALFFSSPQAVRAADDANLVQKNVFAYNVTVNSSNPQKPTVSFRLNGLASSVSVTALIDGKSVATKTITAPTTEATQSVTFDLTGKSEGVVTFSVNAVNKTSVSTPTLIVNSSNMNTYNGGTDKFLVKFYNPNGVAVNKCTDSETFGRIAVTEARDYTSSETAFLSNKSSGSIKGGGLYVLTPQFKRVKGGNDVYGSKGGLTTNASDYTFFRLKYSDDGRLFMTSLAKGQKGLYEWSEDYTTLTPIFNGTVDSSTGVIKNSGGTIIGGMGAALDVYGTEENLKIALGSTTNLESGTSGCQNIYVYNLGKATSWNKAPSCKYNSKVAYSNYFVRPYTAHIAWDDKGGGFYYSNRSDNPSKEDFNLAHFKICADSTNGIGNNLRSWLHKTDGNYLYIEKNDAMVYNKDRSILAIACRADKDNQNPTIRFYKISDTNEAGKNPTYTLLDQKIAVVTSTDKTNYITAMDFDYAGNLYCVNANLQGLFAYQLPESLGGTKSTSIPSKKSQEFTRTVTVSGPTDIKAVATNGGTLASCKVVLSWAAATVDQDIIDHYIIYRREENGKYDDGVFTPYSTKELSFTDTSIPAWGKYYYRIAAYASNGQVGSYVYLSTYGSGVTFTEPIPAQVTGVSATTGAWSGAKQTSNVTWTAATNAAKYNVYVNNAVAATVTGTSATVEISTTSGKASSIVVAGVNANGTEGEKSSAVTVYNSGFGGITTANISWAENSSHKADVTLTWNAPQYGTVKYYSVTRDDDVNNPIYSGTATSLVDQNVAWGSHKYAISAQMNQKIATSASTTNMAGTNRILSIDIIEPTPAAVGGLSASASKWSGTAQQVSISWSAMTYASSYNVYVNGALTSNVSTTSATVSIPTNGSASTVTVAAVNSSGTEGQCSSINVFNTGFSGSISLTDAKLVVNDNGRQDAVINWKWSTAPSGTVDHFEVCRVSSDGNTLTVIASGIATNVLTYTDTNIGASTRSYQVRAIMKESLALSESDTNVNSILSANILSVNGSSDIHQQPTITAVTTGVGRNCAYISWGLSFLGTKPDYYTVTRDGITIVDQTTGNSVSDTIIPDGDHDYIVTGVYNNGAERIDSDPYTITIKHQSDETGYAVTEVYNYHIYTKEEFAAKGSPKLSDGTDNAVVVNDSIPNFKTPIGEYGAPGDVYRQGTYRDGHWYIAQLTDAMPADGDSYLKNPAAFGSTDNDLNGVNKGGIISFDANDPRQAVTRRPTLLSWENQSVAVDDNGNIITRSGGKDLSEITKSTGDPYLFYRPISYLNVARSGSVSRVDISDLGFKQFQLDHRLSTGDQLYRTHYISANGDASSASGANLLLAMNLSPDVWKINITADNKYTAQVYRPDEFTENQQIDRYENFAFPMPDEMGGFIQQIRSDATYYVDNDGHYTKIYSDKTDVTNVGGAAFTYDGRLFLLHPISTKSVNIGDFRIDIANKNDLNDNVATSDMSSLFPLATVIQDVNTNDTSTQKSVSANWFGAEKGTYRDEVSGTDKECIYIYQYVPGVRFAKYRFYSYSTPATPQPTLEIKTIYTYDEDDVDHTTPVDIDRYVAELTWTRTAGDYTISEDYHLDHYEVELLNDQLQAIATETIDVDPDRKGIDETYTATFGTETSDFNPGEANTMDGMTYTARLTPVYINSANELLKLSMETTASQDNNTYSVGLGDVSVKTFATRDTNTNYRVDIDFNPADLTKLRNANGDVARIEPVSFFKIRVHKPDMADGEYADIPGLMICIGGTRVAAEELEYSYRYSADNASENTLVPGAYKFDGEAQSTYVVRKGCQRHALREALDDNSEPATNCGDKNYALSEIHEGAAEPCVAYYWTKENPIGNSYQIEAVYAASNVAISNKATLASDPVVANITTDNIDMTVNSSDLSVYPVPAKELLNVSANRMLTSATIYTTTGAVVKRFDNLNDNIVTLDVSSLPAGAYILHVDGYSPLQILKK